MTKRARLLVAAAIGLVLGAAVGWLIGWLVRSDNAPFFVALGALAGLWGGLAWARVLPPVLLAAIGLLALARSRSCSRRRAPIHAPAPPPIVTASPAPRADGQTADQVSTLSSLRKVGDYPLYTMRYHAGRRDAEVASRARGVSCMRTCSVIPRSREIGER